MVQKRRIADAAMVKPKLRYVALQERPDKVLPPSETVLHRPRQKGPGKLAADPEFLQQLRSRFSEIQSSQLHELDTPGKALGDSADKERRGASEDHVPGSVSGAVHQHPEGFEKFRHALRLVEDDQSAKGPQRQAWILEPAAVRHVFEVEVAELPLPAQQAGERRLAALAGTEERRDRRTAQRGHEAAKNKRSVEHGPESIMHENPELRSEL
jgi:hypothetical protein